MENPFLNFNLFFLLFCKAMNLQQGPGVHRSLADEAVFILNSLPTENLEFSLVMLRDEGLTANEHFWKAFVVAVSSYELAQKFIDTFGAAKLRCVDPDRFGIIKRLKDDKEIYIPILKLFVEYGIPLSELEQSVFMSLGLQADSVNTAQDSVDKAHMLVKALNQNSIKLDYKLMEFMLSKYFIPEFSKLSWLQDCLYSSLFAGTWPRSFTKASWTFKI